MENTNENTYKYKVFGISTNGDKKFDDLFDVVYDDYNMQAVSKQTFEHDAEDLKFKYQYVISVEDTATYSDDDERKLIYSLTLVPTFKSINKQKQEKIMGCMGCGDTIDVMDYGCGVTMMVETKDIPTDFQYDYTEDNTLDAIANVFESIDRLRGFYIDKPWNRIGTTGWDTLNDCINGIDMFKESLRRIDKK